MARGLALFLVVLGLFGLAGGAMAEPARPVLVARADGRSGDSRLPARASPANRESERRTGVLHGLTSL